MASKGWERKGDKGKQVELSQSADQGRVEGKKGMKDEWNAGKIREGCRVKAMD